MTKNQFFRKMVPSTITHWAYYLPACIAIASALFAKGFTLQGFLGGLLIAALWFVPAYLILSTEILNVIEKETNKEH